MANVKISDLTGAASASGTQEFEVNDSGTSKKVTGSQLATFIEGEVSSSPTLTGQVSLDNGTNTAPSLTNTGDTNTGLYFPSDDTVALTAGGSANLSVNSSGVSVDGNLSFGDNDKAIFGAGSDLQIYHDGSHSYVSDQGTGNIKILADDFILKNSADTETMIQAFTDASVSLWYDNSSKLATTATGIDVTGTAVTDGLTVAGNVSVDGGTIKLDGNYPVGTANVALGDSTLASGSFSGSDTIAIGMYALEGNTSGSGNVAVGSLAMITNTTGNYNTAIGSGQAGVLQGALGLNTSGSSNTAVGYQSLRSNTSASNNTAVGYQSLYANTTGSENTAVGREALKLNTTGYYNAAFGHQSLDANTTGFENSAFGMVSLTANTTGSYNTAVGTRALQANTTASNNTAVGYQAGYSSTTGTNMTAIGYQALDSNTTGSGNTTVGVVSLQANTTGADNTALGYGAALLNTTGSNNTALGQNALRGNTTANNNTAVGRDAGYSSTTGVDNTYLGAFAGELASTASNNTFIGRASGNTITTGSKNTILGRYSGNQGGLDIRTSSNNIVLSDGDGNPRVHVDSSGRMSIGDALSNLTNFNCRAHTTSAYAADFAVRTNGYGIYLRNASNTVVGTIIMNASSTSYNTSSDYRLKENVVELTGATDRLKQLNPSRFNFIADADTTVDGFLAHEVQSVVPEAVTGTKDAVDTDGNPEYQGIDQSKLVPLLVATIQELEARITALEGN